MVCDHMLFIFFFFFLIVAHLLCFLVGAVHLGEEIGPQFVLEGDGRWWLG